jgi:curved DNA-binding protein CbpA
MATAFQYKPRFVDIRVRPPAPEEAEPPPALEPGERLCDHVGCRRPASTRAPKTRHPQAEHYWFCQAHAAEYNRAWNFFSGMTEAEIRARLADEMATGGRPTWSFGSGMRNREAAARRGFFRDAFGIFSQTRPRSGEAEAAADRRLGKLERAALADLDLDLNAPAPAIRARYIELVKRCHPDANGGDRSAEHRLARVIRAYKTLRKAKLA